MREIFKVSEIRRLIRRGKALIGGLPFSGKTTLIKEACEDYCEERGVQFIELPKKFNNIDELNQWKEKIKGVGKAIIEGRSYIIDLLLGKVSLADKPSLQSLNLDLRGNIVSMKSLDAIEKIYYNGIRDDSAVSKILMYSTVTMSDYYTVIPRLVDEGIELYKQGKLNKILELVLGLKRLYYSFPKGDVSGEDSVIYALEKVIPKDIDFKTTWSELSETWKELTYYRLDSALRLLPGSAERIVSQREIRPMGDKVNLVDVDPFFVSLAEEGMSILLNGNNLCIVGPIRSGKSTLANYVHSMANLGDVEVVDYNNYDLLKLKEKLSSENKRFIAVLTEDILYALPLECAFIFSDTYVKDFIDYLYLKNNKIRRRKYNINIPHYYYYLYKLKYNMSYRKIEDEYRSDMTKYVISTIFGNNNELINNYLPLLVLGHKYLPFPPKVSKIILRYFNKQVDETFITWFSVFDFHDYEIGESEEIESKETEVIEKTREELIKEVKEKKLENDLLKVFFHRLISDEALPNIKIEDFVETAQGSYSPITQYILYNPDIIEELNWDLGEKLSEVGNSLRSIEDIIGDEESEIGVEKLAKGKIPYRLKKKIIEFYESNVNNYQNIYRILSSKNVNIGCLRKASKILKLYIVNAEDLEVFPWFEDKLYNAIIKTKDEELIRDYAKMSFKYFARYNTVINKEHLEWIEEISDYAKLAVTPIIRPYEVLSDEISVDDIKDPVEVYATLLSLIYLGIYGAEPKMPYTLVKYYSYIDPLYEKFVNYIKNIDEQSLSIIFDIVYDAQLDNKNHIFDFITQNVQAYGFGTGIIMFVDYDSESEFEEALEYIDSLVQPTYITLTRKKEMRDEELESLFEIYIVKLARVLLASRYEYKSVLQDIIELYSKAKNIKDKELEERIRLAYLISKLILYKEVEKTIPKLPEAILYKTSLALISGEEEKREFLKEVEAIRIGGKPIIEKLEYALEKLVPIHHLIPVLKAYFYLKGERTKILKMDEYLKNKIRGIPMFISNKIFNEIDAKENKNKFAASLILFI